MGGAGAGEGEGEAAAAAAAAAACELLMLIADAADCVWLGAPVLVVLVAGAWSLLLALLLVLAVPAAGALWLPVPAEPLPGSAGVALLTAGGSSGMGTAVAEANGASALLSCWLRLTSATPAAFTS